MEEEKAKKYKYKDLFNNEKERKQIEIKENAENLSLVEYKENIFTKILNKIKKLFKKD